MKAKNKKTKNLKKSVEKTISKEQMVLEKRRELFLKRIELIDKRLEELK